MKKIINNISIIAFVICAFGMSSCNDFLETAPVDRLTSDGFYQTQSQSEQGVIGIYGDLRAIPNDEYLYLSECRSDNTWVNPQTDGYREYSEIGTFRAGKDVSTFNSAWNAWYKVIYDANVALEKIPGATISNEKFRDQLMGEVYFLRGWAYFELVRLFGSVPLIDKAMSPADVFSVPQSTAREIYDRIILPDLKEAQTLLPLLAEMVDANGKPVTDGNQGRADRIAATAMLSRVYMTLAGFPMNDASAKALAESELKSVIDYAVANNKFWAPDSTAWRKQWMYEGNNQYSVFAIQHRSGSASSGTEPKDGNGNLAIFNFSPALPPSYTKWRIFSNQIYVEKTLMYEFDKVFSNGNKDARGVNHSILLGYEAEGGNFPTPYSNLIDTLKLADGTVVNVHINTMFYKYMNSKRKRAALGLDAELLDETMVLHAYDWPINYPVIRYEDILLMYAEILVEKNDITGAMKIVNDIRTRAGCDAETASSSDEALKFVKRERRIELMGEGVRWFDLVRWGEWKSAISSSFNRYNNPNGVEQSNLVDGRYLYPIPQNQINVNPGLYNQNPGYQ